MHDVVSHQVSLIAVQAGALRMTSTDPTTRETAATPAHAGCEDLDPSCARWSPWLPTRTAPRVKVTPAPRLATCPASVLDKRHRRAAVRRLGALAGVAGADRASRVRTVQEALTNVRKHATGAQVTVELVPITGRSGSACHTSPDAATSRRPPGEPVPERAVKTVGLRERAVLGGTLQQLVYARRRLRVLPGLARRQGRRESAHLA